MANDEHLKILKQGATAWNQWRRQHSAITPDLSDAPLSGANLPTSNLANADLTNANLTHANLSGADLSSANLACAWLNSANLSGANLFGACLNSAHLSLASLACNLTSAKLVDADLSGARLSGARLIAADLTNAWLFGADLLGANLCGATLEGAIFCETFIGNTNLSEVKGLTDCDFRSPCTIDLRTLQRSGMLPEAFLRGCGLPDEFIAYLPSFLNQPLQFYSCFISYSSQDDPFARRLHADLQAHNVRCWFAPEDLKIGEKFRPKIDESIRLHDKLLLVLSEQSLASDWVEAEVETCLEKERQTKETVLFPIRLDDAVLHTSQAWAAHIRRTRHIGDFSRWKDHDVYQESFKRVLRDLKPQKKK